MEKKSIISYLIPQEILELREHFLNNRKVIHYIIDEIFNTYNFNDAISNTLLNIIHQIFHSTMMSISDLIVFIEENIEKQETYTVELNSATNSITIQTIHGSKGLEYPIVFVVNCNQASFPITSSNSNSITFNEIVGLRTKRVFSKEHNYVFDNWKTHLVNINLFSDMDEERRLLYVAITRAMFRVYITSHKPSIFFRGLAKEESEKIEEANVQMIESSEEQTSDELRITTKIEDDNRVLSVHDLMNIEENQKGRGMEFGTSIHKVAFRYIQGLKIEYMKEEFKQDFDNLKYFIDTKLKGGKFLAEIDCSLPINNTLIRGVIDLVVEFDERVEIIDWKTDLVKDNRDEYAKQLSVYYHVLKEVYPNKNIVCKIFWTHRGEEDIIEPISKKEELIE